VSRYMQSTSRGEEVIVRPWVWIICLFAGPMTATVLHEQHAHFAVCISNFFHFTTELGVFKFTQTRMLTHATAMMTQLLLEHALRMRVKADVDSASSDSEDNKEKKDVNLTGKLNNLVTSDMANLGGFRDMINVLFQGPLTFTVGTFILYSILGWRYVIFASY
jgi:hypothetical protein